MFRLVKIALFVSYLQVFFLILHARTQPPDFDEEIIRQSPTFQKWLELQQGQKLKYACREFVRGRGDDEERLMRRIMIARRNNIRDHETLKQARSMQKRPPSERRKASAMVLQDHVVEREMDVGAVEGTRSYKRWMDLPEGAQFVYNQRYVKGKEGHDWLLKKNIWRRMRYRRENKKMVERLKTEDPPGTTTPPQGQAGDYPQHHHDGSSSNCSLVDGLQNNHARQQRPHHARFAVAGTTTATNAPMVNRPGAAGLLVVHGDLTSSVDGTGSAEDAVAAAAAAAAADHFADQAAIEAAVAAAEHFGKTTTEEEEGGSSNPLMVHDPLQAAAAQAALDAAARLAHISHASKSGLTDHHHKPQQQQHQMQHPNNGLADHHRHPHPHHPGQQQQHNHHQDGHPDSQQHQNHQVEGVDDTESSFLSADDDDRFKGIIV